MATITTIDTTIDTIDTGVTGVTGVTGAPLPGVLRLGRLAASFDPRTTPREDVVAAITGARATPAP